MDQKQDDLGLMGQKFSSMSSIRSRQRESDSSERNELKNISNKEISPGSMIATDQVRTSKS